MKRVAICLIAAAGAVSLPILACDNPALVQVPNGAESSMDELLAAQNDVRAYMSAMEAYLACLNAELQAAGEEAAAEFKSLMITRHNSGVAEMEAIAAKFNEQIQAYREANPGE